MSCHMSKELKEKYNVRSIPIRKGDTVKIVRGRCKGKDGKVETVFRRNFCIHVDKIVREKANGK